MKKLLSVATMALVIAVGSIKSAMAQSAILGATSEATVTATKAGSVLGASTSTLSNTGQNIILSVIVGAVLIAVVAFVAINNRKKQA